jgi:hypothetical protein
MTKKPEPPCDTCGRKPGERKPRCLRCAEKPRDALLPEPLPGRYLVVDPGSKCGWAIAPADHFDADHGQGSVWTTEPSQVVDRARSLGCEALVMEAPGLGPSMPPAATFGLGRSAGVWEWLWRTSGEALGRRSVVVQVPAMTWRSTILGGPQRPTEEWKAAAQAHCRRVHNIEAGTEEADAICLAEHALHSLEVADAVGVRRLKQLGWVEPTGFWKDGRFTHDPLF